METTPIRESLAIRVDGQTSDSWTQVISGFSDATIYQTWAFGASRWGDKSLSHVVIEGNDAMAAAQVRVIRLPGIKAGIAYVSWGPMWRPKSRRASPTVFRATIQTLLAEYVRRRGLLLRIVPFAFESLDQVQGQILKEEGLKETAGVQEYRTIVLDLSRPIDEIRASFDTKWRNCLNKSDREIFEISIGDGLDLYDDFLSLYRQMIEIKQFVQFSDPIEYKRVQEMLPPQQRMRIMVCHHYGEPVSAVVGCGLGDTYILLLAATNAQGRKLNAAYSLKWYELQWAKENGFRWYDSGGVNRNTNPGVYHFKAGILGKHGGNGYETHQIGPYEAWNNPLSYLALNCVAGFRSLTRSIRCIRHTSIGRKKTASWPEGQR